MFVFLKFNVNSDDYSANVDGKIVFLREEHAWKRNFVFLKLQFSSAAFCLSDYVELARMYNKNILYGRG